MTFINVLSTISSLSLLGLVRQIHALALKSNAMHANSIENAFLVCYGKCGQMDECENIFSGMSDRKDDLSWNIMISGYLHNEVLPKAMDLVWLCCTRGRNWMASHLPLYSVHVPQLQHWSMAWKLTLVQLEAV